MAVGFTINGKPASVDVEKDTPLLWVVREHLKLMGTKFGCGSGLCGACTVHLDGKAVRACQTTMGEAAGKKVTTIEGLSPTSSHPLQKAWIAEQVPQRQMLPSIWATICSRVGVLFLASNSAACMIWPDWQ